MRERGVMKAAVAVALCLTIGLAGCSTDWIGQGEEIVAVLIPAATNLVALVAALEGKTLSETDLQIIQSAGSQAGADLQLVQALIAAYQKADAATKPGILNEIESAIGAAQANLEGLLAALHIKDAATQAKITAVVGILLAEVQSLAAVVGAVSGSGLQASGGQGSHPFDSSSQSSGSLRAGSVAQNATRVAQPHPRAPLSAREFVKSFNATLTAKTGNAELDRATAALVVRQHGTVARWGLRAAGFGFRLL